VITPEVLQAFADAAVSRDENDLVRGAMCLPLIEYREVDTAAVTKAMTRLGALATLRIERLGPEPSPQSQVEALNRLLFDEEGFRGNDEQYEDPRNSYLNEVLARRKGLPIALCVLYLDVARRAGVPMEGVNFPGHFLVRYRTSAHHPEHPRDLVVDPFHAGAVLGEADLRSLLRRHAGDEAAYDRRLLHGATRAQILTRMAVNLKRLYVAMRSFPQAKAATDMLLALDPASTAELRDRGLLFYHLHDFPAALRDLEDYLQATARGGPPTEDLREEVQQIWEHVKTLRRRVAGLN
jgi:regulator of sirC expression with transglutaminase-like and TPR domain